MLKRQAVQAAKHGNNGFGLTLANEAQIWARTWSTPKASDGEKGGPNMRGSKGDLPLPSQAAQWMTPRVTTGEYTRDAGNPDKPRPTLEGQAANWATPTARMSKGGGDAVTRSDGKSRMDMLDWQAEAWSRSSCPDPTIPLGEASSTDGRNSHQPSTKSRLNVCFAEALMRWPTGWTDFGCSETGSTLWRQRMRGYVLTLLTARIANERQATFL